MNKKIAPPDPAEVKIARTLVAARIAAKVSQAKIAERAGVTQKTVSQFELGRSLRASNRAAVVAAYADLDVMPESAGRVHIGNASNSSRARGKSREYLEHLVPSVPWTADRLQDMVRNFIHENDLTILERGRTGARQILMGYEQAFELGATILLACGHNVR